MAGEMASVGGWDKGGIFTWVKGSLGDRAGWTAMFYQWIHITVGMNTNGTKATKVAPVK